MNITAETPRSKVVQAIEKYELTPQQIIEAMTLGIISFTEACAACSKAVGEKSHD